MHHADQRLPRRQAADNVLTERAFAHTRNKIPHHRQRHIRLEQGYPHLAQRVLNVGLGQACFATQGFDHLREAAGQIFKHV